MPTRILLADDHTLVRAGIKSLLQTIPEVLVVAETGDGAEALELIRRERPDLALLDISMPGMNGLEVIEWVKRERLPTRILVLSMHTRESYVADALHAGAAGYLQKSAAVVELPAALEAVARGERYLSAGISPETVRSLQSGGPVSPISTLSPRQLEILRMIGLGSTNKEIAFELGISSKTVDTHRAQIMEKLGIHTVQALVRFAIRSGLVPDDDP